MHSPWQKKKVYALFLGFHSIVKIIKELKTFVHLSFWAFTPSCIVLKSRHSSPGFVRPGEGRRHEWEMFCRNNILEMCCVLYIWNDHAMIRYKRIFFPPCASGKVLHLSERRLVSPCTQEQISASLDLVRQTYNCNVLLSWLNVNVIA